MSLAFTFVVFFVDSFPSFLVFVLVSLDRTGDDDDGDDIVAVREGAGDLEFDL